MTGRDPVLTEVDVFRLSIPDYRPGPDLLARAGNLTADDVEALVSYNGGALVPLIEEAARLDRIAPVWSQYALILGVEGG